MTEQKKHYAKPEELKYYVLIFQMVGHETWHWIPGKTMEVIDKQLKAMTGVKITAKKFFEIDRLTGTFEEF